MTIKYQELFTKLSEKRRCFYRRGKKKKVGVDGDGRMDS